jgi:hypothetical protein
VRLASEKPDFCFIAHKKHLVSLRLYFFQRAEYSG